jgi:hypothetical protein
MKKQNIVTQYEFLDFIKKQEGITERIFIN